MPSVVVPRLDSYSLQSYSKESVKGEKIDTRCRLLAGAGQSSNLRLCQRSKQSDHAKMSLEVEKSVLSRYTLEKRIGKGAYGVVYKAQDKHTGEVVALKKCFEAFRNATDAQRTFREIGYLQEMEGHENIVQLKHVIMGDNNRDIYLAFDLMESDLYQANKAGILQEVHKQFITYQLLKALKYIHSAGLVHRDIKPSNILINTDCRIKLCDFGLCRSIEDANNAAGQQRRLTDYIATRWYRPPEILLGSTRYCKNADLWSVGCILGELIRGRALYAGSSTLNQIERILEYTGMPSQEDLVSTMSPFAQTMIDNVTHFDGRKRLSELCEGGSKDALDLVRCCLRFNPKKRTPAGALLRHAYLSAFHDKKKEPKYPHGPIQLDIEDSVKLSPQEYRDKLCRHIEERRMEALKRQRDKVRSRGSLAAVTMPPELVEESYATS